MDMPAYERWCHNKRHEKEMEVTDAWQQKEEDAAGVEAVAAGWEDEDYETGIKDYKGQKELGASVDNRWWYNKTWRQKVNKKSGEKG